MLQRLLLVFNGTGEVLRPAPLFDHGASFDIGECRWLPRGLQLETFLRPRHEAMLEAAARLELKWHPEVRAAESAIAMMQDYVRRVAKDALEILDRQDAGPRPEEPVPQSLPRHGSRRLSDGVPLQPAGNC